MGPRQSKRQSLRFAKAISAAPYHRETSAFLQNEKRACLFVAELSFFFVLNFFCLQPRNAAESVPRICILWSWGAAFSWDI
jgi:hypothetical protein